jgi:hypothetical protein
MMQSPNQPANGASAKLENAIATARTLVLALAMSVGLYMLVGTFVAQEGDSGADVATYRIPLVSIAFASLIASVMYRRVNLLMARLEQVHTARGEAGLARHLLTTTVVSAALGDVVGICGLLVGILTGDTYTMYALCAAALIAILFSLPRANGWREAYRQIALRAPVAASPMGD